MNYCQIFIYIANDSKTKKDPPPPTLSSLEDIPPWKKLFVRIYIYISNIFSIHTHILYIYIYIRVKEEGGGGGSKRHGGAAMKLLINGGVDMKYRTLTYRVSVMYS